MLWLDGGVVLLVFSAFGKIPGIINAEWIMKIQTPTVDMLYFRDILKACIFLKCVVWWLFQLLCGNFFIIAPITMALVAYFSVFCMEKALLLETWRLQYLFFFLYKRQEIEIYFMLYFSFTGKLIYSKCVKWVSCWETALVLMKERFFINLILFFKLLFSFSFPL